MKAQFLFLAARKKKNITLLNKTVRPRQSQSSLFFPPLQYLFNGKSWAAGLVGSKCVLKAEMSTETAAAAALAMHSWPRRSSFSLSENGIHEAAVAGCPSRGHMYYLGGRRLTSGRKEKRNCHPRSASRRPDPHSCDIFPDYHVSNHFQSDGCFFFKAQGAHTRRPSITAASCDLWMSHSKRPKAFSWLLNFSAPPPFTGSWYCHLGLFMVVWRTHTQRGEIREWGRGSDKLSLLVLAS